MSAPPSCPFCDEGPVERVGRWGGQIITSQWRCEACGSYFEAIREDFGDPLPADDGSGRAGASPSASSERK